MRLSRSRLVALGIALVVVGVAGQASADTTSHRDTAARPAVSASAPAPATRKPATKPAPKKSAVKVVGKGHSPIGPAGSRMTTGGKAVALTFDDGPDPATTPQLLKMLAQQKVHATFCLIGKNVQKHPDLVRRIVAGGHTVCNHTWSHSLTLGKEPAAKIKADLAKTSAAIHKAAPKAKIKYFRAPGGNFTPRLVAVARQLGMTSIYWRVDPRDWDQPKGETDAQHKSRVIWRVEHYTHNGAIVLSHDYAQPGTVAAYRTLLPWLRKRFQLTALPV